MRADFSQVLVVEGATGSGKTSLLRGLSDRYGCKALELGVLVRGVAWWAFRHRTSVPDAVAAMARLDAAGRVELPLVLAEGLAAVDLSLNEMMLGNEAFQPTLAEFVTAASISPEGMPWVHSLARERVRGQMAVISGRDVAIETCPGAGLVVRLTADARVRAERKMLQLAMAGLSGGWSDDAYLLSSPVPGTVVVDTTAATKNAVLDTVGSMAERRFGWRQRVLTRTTSDDYAARFLEDSEARHPAPEQLRLPSDGGGFDAGRRHAEATEARYSPG